MQKASENKHLLGSVKNMVKRLLKISNVTKAFPKKSFLILILLIFDAVLAAYLLLTSPIFEGARLSWGGSFQNGVKTIYLLTHTPAFNEVISESNLPSEAAYGGVSWADFNNDSFLDLFYPTSSGAKLYQNNGNETFTDVTKKSGLGGDPGIFAGIFGDYDNDGCQDLYLSRNGTESKHPSISSTGRTDLLYKNNCDGTFTDISKKAGIADEFHGEGASWVDFDGNGLIDIYVVNVGRWQDHLIWTYEPNLLYRNNGNGTFSEVSEVSGVSGYAQCSNFETFKGKFDNTSLKSSGETRMPKRGGWKMSFQPAWLDYNNDLKPDLFIATDSGVSPLYKNLGHGKFLDVTEKSGMCRDGTGMGASVGDYNNDGYLDIYVTNVDQNFLWKNNGDETFTETSIDSGVANLGSLGWGTGFLDYDNDGLLDLYAVNGIVLQEDTRYRITKRFDRLFRNLNGASFMDVSDEEGLFGNDAKLSSAYGDYNNDGFTDAVVISDGARLTGVKLPNRLYKNRPNGNNWITIKLAGTSSNRDGIGARIVVKTSTNAQVREVAAGSSFLSQNSLWQTFGLGNNKNIEEIVVKWPSGVTQTLKNIKPNQKIIITEQQ